MKEKKYLKGKKLSKKLNIPMWTLFDWETLYRSSYDHKSHYQVFEHLVITPLGVAAICSDETGLFDVNRSIDLANNNGRLVGIHSKVSPSTIRFNKRWVEELATMAKIKVRVKLNGTVGACCVPAVSFIEESESYVEVIE